MAKLSKEELISKISDKIEDIDLATELLEDIADSFDFDDSELKSKIESLTSELDSVKTKYKERFSTNTSEEDTLDVKVEDTGLKEEEVIDIKELDLKKEEE